MREGTVVLFRRVGSLLGAGRARSATGCSAISSSSSSLAAMMSSSPASCSPGPCVASGQSSYSIWQATGAACLSEGGDCATGSWDDERPELGAGDNAGVSDCRLPVVLDQSGVRVLRLVILVLRGIGIIASCVFRNRSGTPGRVVGLLKLLLILLIASRLGDRREDLCIRIVYYLYLVLFGIVGVKLVHVFRHSGPKDFFD